jgi:hypothetical protein
MSKKTTKTGFIIMSVLVTRLNLFIIIFALFAVATGSIVAQEAVQKKDTVFVRGTVREAAGNEPMSAVNVTVQTIDSVFINGTITDDDGLFVFANIKEGKYRLIISSIGYSTKEIEFSAAKSNRDAVESTFILEDIFMEEDVVNLGAVTVLGSSRSIDRKLVFPTQKQIESSANGIELLQQLMLPRIQINPLTRAVTMLGGEGEVQLRINGVKVETAEVVALLPENVIRVEFHDNPGLRYGGASAVIDYIVRRNETGGNLGLDMFDAFDAKKFGNNGISGRINHKKSEFAVNYSARHRDFHSLWRDNIETFHLSDLTAIRRKEEGEPGDATYIEQNMNASYSYMNDLRQLNATVRYFDNDITHNDFFGRLYNMDNPSDYVGIIDRAPENYRRPAIDLYFQENMKRNQTLSMNLVGTYNRTVSNRIYSESRNDLVLTDINNSVTVNKYSFIGEGIYEKRLDAGRISAGLKHTQSFSDNTYNNVRAYNTRMQQGETFLFSEWKGNVRKLDYTVGAGVTRASFISEDMGEDGGSSLRSASIRQTAGEYIYYTFNPRIAVSLLLPGNSSLRLTSSINNNMPSLSELSPVQQAIDSLQIQRGNPNLKPYIRYTSKLNYEYRRGIFYSNLQLQYDYSPSAIMDEKFLEDNLIVQTWDNQRNRQYANVNLSLRAGPVKDVLTVMLNGGLNHYVSNGNTYRHVYNNPFLSINVFANYKSFQAGFQWDALTWNRFNGETMTGGETMYLIFINYKYRNATIGVGGLSPFSNSYRQDSENRSALASYKRSIYVNDICGMYFFNLSWNINFGRKFDAGQKRLNNSDDEAGVMKSGK